jgi:hypothetical protein
VAAVVSLTDGAVLAATAVEKVEAVAVEAVETVEKVAVGGTTCWRT